MTEHVLKTWPNAFDAIRDGRKRFEWRRDDRGYEVGDVLVLRRWDPLTRYVTGPDYPELRVMVTYILRGAFDIPPNFCIMSIEPVSPPQPQPAEESDQGEEG